jgi:hypothetical protein
MSDLFFDLYSQTKMKKLLLIFILFASFLVFALTIKASASSKPSFIDNDIKIYLSQIQSNSEKKQSYLMEVTLVNESGEPIDIREGVFILEKENQTVKERRSLGPNFWAPVSIRKYIVSENKRNFDTEFYLRPGEKIKMEIDLLQLKWQQSLLSIYPNKKLHDIVPKDIYDLYFQFQIKEKDGKYKTFKSNMIKLIISPT